MSVVVIHLDPETQRLRGVWTSPEDAAYVRGADDDRAVGALLMRDKYQDLSWDDWCTYLSDSRPHRVWWHSMEFPDGVPADAVLAQLRQQEADNA